MQWERQNFNLGDSNLRIGNVTPEYSYDDEEEGGK
jgi:hypothetical protein